MTTEQLGKVMQTPIQKGEEVTDQNSKFLAYTVCADEIETIQNAYHKIKLLHPAADHVICAYALPEENLFMQDYCDDGEHGGGRALLTFLLQNKLACRAIFVVRYFGGVKLGMNRYDRIREAAAFVIKKYPTNSILQRNQDIDDDTVRGPQNPQLHVRGAPVRRRNSRGRRPWRTTGPPNRSVQRSQYPGSMRGSRSTTQHYAQNQSQRGRNFYRNQQYRGETRGTKRKYPSDSFKNGYQCRPMSPYHPDYVPPDRELDDGSSVYSQETGYKEDWSNDNQGEWTDFVG